jgi:hypothetical protein
MRYLLCVISLVGPIALAIGVPALRAEPRIGTVVQKNFNGAHGARVVAAAEAEPLYYGNDVFAEEKVVTPAGGSTVMRFSDQTQLQIGANSTVVLDRFVYDADSQSADASMKFTKGIFRYVAGQAKNEQDIKLSTPTTTLTIRGTKFIIFVATDGGTTVEVIDGQVDLKPCGGGNTARAQAGQIYEVAAACTGAVQVGYGIFPADPAIEGDYVGGDPGSGVTGGAGQPPGAPAAGPPARGGGFGNGGGHSDGPPG